MKWHQIFFWLLLLFLPTQLGVHFWPDWAHVLGRRVDYLSPTLYLTDILVVLTIITWFLSSRDPARRGVAISHFMRLLRGVYTELVECARNDKVRKARSVIITTLLFITINVFFAVNRPVAIYKWLKVGEFVALGWYIVRTKPSLSRVTFPLSLGILYSSILAIAQFVLQHSIGGPLWWLGERTFDVGTPGIARYDFNFSLFTFPFSLFGLRPYATFPHPNVLGGFLAVVLPLIISNFSREAGSRFAGQFPISNQMKKFSIFKIITVVAGLIALFLTFSRSAIVVGAIATAAVFFSRRRALLFLSAVAMVFSLFTFHFSLFTSSEESVVVRQQLNAAAVKLWQTSPVVGVGLGNFLVRLPEALPTRTIYFLQPVHNIYLLLMSEVGIVGLSVFLWLLWRSLRNFKFQISNFKLLLLALLILGLNDHYPLTLQQGQLLLTILIAMSYN